MRIIVVWAVAIPLLLSVSIGWYVSLPVCFALSMEFEGMITGSGLSALRIVEYVAILWGPIFDVFIVFWAFLESHRIDKQGVMMGG